MWVVTGGCGFVGSNLVARLLHRDSVVVIDDLSRFGSDRNLKWLRSIERTAGSDLQFIRCDVADKDAVRRVFEASAGQVAAVAHCAGQVAMTTSLKDPWRDFATNAMGTLNVLESVRACCPHATVLFSSTNKVYGSLSKIATEELTTRYSLPEYPDGLPESLPLDLSTPYGCSKGAADQYMRDWHRSYGLNTVVFRHSSIYGGRQFSTYDQGWIGWFCQKALEQQRAPRKPRSFTISGDGKQVRDVLSVDDLVRLYLTAHERIADICGEIFNIGGGVSNSLSLLELFSFLENTLDVELSVEWREWRPADQRVFVADIGKVREQIGWQPQVGYEEGIFQVLKWLAEDGAR